MKSIFKKSFALLVLNACAFFATAQQDDLKSLVNTALEYYPKLKAQQAMVDISKTRIDISKSYNLPNVSGVVSYNRIDPVSEEPVSNGQGGTNTLKFMPNNNYNAMVSVYYPVLDFGKTKTSIEKASEEYQLANTGLDNSKFNLAYQIANIYYAILYLNKSLLVKDAEIKLLNDNIKIIESKIKYGDALDFDLLNTQVKLTNAENQKSDLQNNRDKQIDMLNSLTGTNNSALKNATNEFSFDTNFLAGDSLLQVAYENNYDVKLSEQKLKVSATDMKLNSKNNNPVLALSAAAGLKNGYLPDLNVITPNSLIGASLNIPIFSGNRNDNLYKISKINNQASQYDLDDSKIIVQRNLQQTLSDIENNLQKYRNADTQIRQANRAVELGNTQYKNGVITNLDLLNSQTNLMLAQLNKLLYEYQLSVSQLEMKRLTGQRFW